MNETQVSPSVALLASYVQGRSDGFQSGVIFTVGAIVLYKALRKKNKGLRIQFVRNNKV